MDVSVSSGAGSTGGIFPNLIPQPTVHHSEIRTNVPQFVIAEPEPAASSAETDDFSGDFFEFEDIGPEPTLEPIIVRSDGQIHNPKERVRKIDPFEIPPGHAELGKLNRHGGGSVDFRVEDPENFVGRMVKGRYEVTEFLGGEEGSFAFLADDKLVEDKLVLVRILLEDDRDETQRGILDEERVTLSHISHPNIARLIDSGQLTDGTRFLVSEYIDALSVNDILSIHGRLEPLRSARIVRQIADALNEIHQEGVLHRDLRPENIIIAPSEDGSERAELVNFGASNGAPTSHNLVYKAPEILDGRVSTIASDVYSLGAVAFEMLTGALPFQGSTSRAILRSQYGGVDNLPTSLRPELPTAVDNVLAKALSFNIAERYAKARDFGDAFYSALINMPDKPADEASQKRRAANIETIKRNAIAAADTGDIAGKNRSSKVPERTSIRSKAISAAAFLMLLGLFGWGWYYITNDRHGPDDPTRIDQNVVASRATDDAGRRAHPRKIAQPPNTIFYENTAQNLRGDLLRNFVGFSLYYPKDWKVNGPQEIPVNNARGKFLDISRLTPSGRLMDQMLVSYYPSKGTFEDDVDKFPQMVKETNETLTKLLPGYEMVSEGETRINGEWRAYEVKFQAGGDSAAGEKLTVWGRRLFIPAARTGVRNGFEITMLATSFADGVHSVDDIGVGDEIGVILNTFEPSEHF